MINRRGEVIAAILAVKPRARARDRARDRDRDRNKSAMTPQFLDYEWTAGRSHEPCKPDGGAECSTEDVTVVDYDDEHRFAEHEHGGESEEPVEP